MAAKKFKAYRRPTEYSDKDKAEYREQAKQKMDAFVRKTAQEILSLRTEGKVGEWQKGWKENPAFGLPKNPVSGHQYTRTNQFLLMLNMILHNWQDARFCSFKQAKKAGEDTHVKEGGFGVTVLRPIIIEKKDENPQDEPDGSREDDEKIVFFRPYKVFHASQIENMPDPDNFFDPIDWGSNNVVERLVNAAGIELAVGDTNNAAYSIVNDKLQMPAIEAFADPAEYYGAMLHEYYHATGHKDREDRFDGNLTSIAAGLKERALEELRAELFSVMAAKTLGLPYDLQNSAAYLNHWQKKCEENPQVILTQATKAAEGLQTVMEFIHGQQPSVSWFPDKATWPEGEYENLVSDIESSGHKFASVVETPFEVREEGDTIVFLSRVSTGNSSQSDVEEAFRIQDTLKHKFGEDISIKVEAQDGRVMVTVREESPDLDPEIGSSPG